LVNDLLERALRGELPPHVARVMLDRLLPPAPPPPVGLGLPCVEGPADLAHASRLIIDALNEGRIGIGE
jgi:hypothetical protein